MVRMNSIKLPPREEGDSTVQHAPISGEETLRVSPDVQYLSEDTRPVDNVIYAYAPVQAEPVRQQPQVRQDAEWLNPRAAAQVHLDWVGQAA